ncbi:MAG: hypothetical protein GX314_05180 [Clostridiaceae bacterium]|jgi:uncharacterized protein YecT (DUF1311 family)|nr:hypothetical protein [Clostridiaceae bacterium]
MMNKVRKSEVKNYLPIIVTATLVFLTVLLLRSWSATAQQNITQNWAASAVYYNSPSAETETFRMSEQEFLYYQKALEMRLEQAYSRYADLLTGEVKEALAESQRDWLKFYNSTTAALEQCWQEPVKIFFEQKSLQRRTNVYREYLLMLLIHRTTDLEEWSAGRLARMDEAFFVEAQDKLEAEKRQLQVQMGLCLYVSDEEYRAKIAQMQKAGQQFLDSNQHFVSLLSAGNKTAVLAEELLQLQRLNYLTSVQYEGCRFFRREREE